MRELEINARTVDEAIKTALDQLGVDENQVQVDVLRKGRTGVLGVGAEEAKVKVKVLDRQQRKGRTAEEAKVVLESLLQYLGITAEIQCIEPSDDKQPIILNIEGEDLGVLIGRRGQALSALQYIAKLIVSEKLKLWVALNIDIAGYKKRRYDSLRNLALRLADQVKSSKRAINEYLKIMR